MRRQDGLGFFLVSGFKGGGCQGAAPSIRRLRWGKTR